MGKEEIKLSVFADDMIVILYVNISWAPQVALVVKDLPANAGHTRDTSLIPGLEDPLE